MVEVRRRFAGVVVLASVVAGCGGGDSTTTTSTTSTTSTTTSTTASDATTGSEPTSSPTTSQPGPPPSIPGDSDAMFTAEVCALLDQDEPPPDLADRMPSAYADATRLLVDLTDTFGPDEWLIPQDVIDRFVGPDTAGAFSALADAMERDCGPSESVEGFRAYSQISELGALDARPRYCDQLAVALSFESDDEASTDALSAAIALAPPEHASALATIQQVRGPEVDQLADPSFATQTLVAAAGLGLYNEARCGVTGSFATMLFTGAFLSASGGSAGGLGGGSPPRLGTPPMPAQPETANAAVPLGSDLTFEVIEIDLKDDGDYLVSAVVPTGWERNDSLFGTRLEPVEGFGIFTKMTIDTGCDGMCQVTDWEARLNGPEGYVSQFRSEDLIVDRPTEGTPGVVMTKPGFSDGIEGIVIRWDDTADRYFKCSFELDESDIDKVDAFTAACEAARPGWITGG